MPIFELVQEMIFVNTCVISFDNRFRNEVCRAVMPFQGGSALLELGGVGYMCPVMPMFELVQEMMFANVCQVS